MFTTDVSRAIFVKTFTKRRFFRFLTYKKYGVSDYTRSGIKMPIGKI